MTVTAPTPTIARDRWGRPLITPPNGGKPVAYTRATTFIDCIEDKFNLQQWFQRMVAIGLVDRPDLRLAVAAHRDDKKELNRICTEAREAASASAAATTGTAIHALAEQLDRGQTLPVIPDAYQADIDAYAAATAELKPVHIEELVVLDTLKIAGTPDRVVTYNGERYIADLKTGSIEYGIVKIAAQLAVYARSQLYTPDGARTVHGASTNRGIIIHVPAGTGQAALHWVDLEAGWAAVQVAKQVRAQRAHKFNDLTEPFGKPLRPSLHIVKRDEAKIRARIESAIAGAPTADAVRAIWADNENDWDDELTNIAKRRVTELSV